MTMSNPLPESDSEVHYGVRSVHPNSRITVPEISRRLRIGRRAVYALLEQGKLPGIRLGRRWIVTRYAYQQWEQTCGTPPGAGLVPKQGKRLTTDVGPQIQEPCR